MLVQVFCMGSTSYCWIVCVYNLCLFRKRLLEPK